MFFQKKNPVGKKDIHVLVLGNRGVGKTSLLATILYKNEMLRSIGIDFTADEDTGQLLDESIKGIENMFNMEDNIKVGGGIEGTTGFQDFRFRLKFTDKSWNEKTEFHIIFHDYAGGILADGEKEKQQYAMLKSYFLASRIVFILIDTPYLMEATGETAGEHNAKDQILTLFQEVGAMRTDQLLTLSQEVIEMSDGEIDQTLKIHKLFHEICEMGDGKMVAIVPTKCEYYLRNDQIVEVEDKIRREFNKLLSCIKQLNQAESEGKNKSKNDEKYKLYITPVQTVGGLEFCTMDNEKGELVANFRRTRPGSHFEPKNTDLLLLLCLRYVFENLLEYLPTKIEPKRRNKIIKSIEEYDGGKELEDCIAEYHKLETKNKKNKNDKELAECFRKMLQEFFSKYSNRKTIIDEICGQYDEIKDWHIINSNIKKLESDFESSFRQYFTQL